MGDVRITAKVIIHIEELVGVFPFTRPTHEEVQQGTGPCPLHIGIMVSIVTLIQKPTGTHLPPE